MVQIIVGENASGKTLYLENVIEKAKQESQNSNSFNFVTNLIDKKAFENIKFNSDKMETLEEILLADKVGESTNGIYILNEGRNTVMSLFI